MEELIQPAPSGMNRNVILIERFKALQDRYRYKIISKYCTRILRIKKHITSFAKTSKQRISILLMKFVIICNVYR